ncbi:hypothetical protein QFC24_005291 [Naganishia onofrii]|uniref:Uncharacterized protein n=1 Tax=Naganishia onofrii TaxID=1851511 RepID=A0ACC2X8V7_9TREE|nr:hypothetical protein QFC24_005291 [Naganishia onofrii]
MYWTAYHHDTTRYNQAEIKAKWEVFKASPGAQYIRYMIEPHVDPSLNRYQALPLISKSISDTLKASVALVTHKGPPRIEVHLLKNYGYGMIHMASLWRALDLATSYPTFLGIDKITIVIHSPPQSAATQPGGMLSSSRYREADEQEDDSESETSDEELVGLLQFCPLLPLTDGFEEDYMVLCTYLMILLRPYAMARLAEGEETRPKPASLGIENLDTVALMTFTAGFIHLTKSDALYATYDIDLELNFTNDGPEKEDIGTLLTLLALTRVNFNKAAETIPYKLQGSFYMSHQPKFIGADVMVDVLDKVLRTRFRYGYETVIREADPLENPKINGPVGADS